MKYKALFTFLLLVPLTFLFYDHVLAFNNNVTRVSVSSAGVEANANSNTRSDISSDGRFVVFISSANNLVSGDTNGFPDVFIRDEQMHMTERVSLSSAGNQANGQSFGEVAVSDDGRHVAFSSSATNLVENDNNGYDDVFVYDRQTGIITTASASLNGAPSNNHIVGGALDISGDGRFVAFSSHASNLVLGDTNNAPDTFIYDLSTNTTERVSVNSFGEQSWGTRDPWETYRVSINGDGRFVAFDSPSNNLVDGDGNRVIDIFVRDRITSTTERVSVSSSGIESVGHSGGIFDISSNGQYVVFDSSGYNLSSNALPNRRLVYIRDRFNQTTELVSLSSDEILPSEGSISGSPSISDDGRYVVFESSTQNFSSTSAERNLFIRDRINGTTELVNVGVDGLGSNAGVVGGGSAQGNISADGLLVVFSSTSTNLITSDTNGKSDIFFRSLLPVINQVPVAVAGEDQIVFEGDVVSFSGLGSSDSDGIEDILSYTWDFGDGTTGNGVTTTHTYADNGMYTVTLMVTDTANQTSSDLVMTTVNNSVSVVGIITVSPDPVSVGVANSASAGFVDGGILDTHSALWDWGDGTTSVGTVTESNGSGSVAGSHAYSAVGQYVVTLTVTDNDGGVGINTYQYVNVVSHFLTALDPLNIWVGLKNSDSVGIKFDLMAEVYKDAQLIGSGELDQVAGGSSGFNNARLNSIPLTLNQPVEVSVGTNLGVRVYVRNTCYGNTHNSGFARLWYNDSAANSGFGTTIDGNTSSRYLVDNFGLSPLVGVGPKLKIDVQSGSPCSEWKQFGTWMISL